MPSPELFRRSVYRAILDRSCAGAALSAQLLQGVVVDEETDRQGDEDQHEAVSPG